MEEFYISSVASYQRKGQCFLGGGGGGGGFFGSWGGGGGGAVKYLAIYHSEECKVYNCSS